MLKTNLSELKITSSWCSYAGSMHGILSSAGLWTEEFWKFYGLSGMAWHFIVHESCCPSSVTVYHWTNEHYCAMDRLGIFTSSDEMFFSPSLNTFKLMQKECEKKIKKSIDQNRGVLVWAPSPCLEFGVIKGYDDTQGIFLTEAVNDPHPDPLLYENLGLGEVPILYCHYVLDQLSFHLEKAIASSLRFGLSEWKKESHIHPQYASGKKAYDLLIQAMDLPKISGFGLAYLLAVYHESRQTLHRFLEWVNVSTKEFPGIEEAVLLYQQVAEYFDQMHQIWPFIADQQEREAPKHDQRQEIKSLLQKAKEREQGAMKAIEKALNLH
jgi:hypothetical protein